MLERNEKMVRTRNKLMVGILALLMAFAVFGVLNVAKVYADAPEGYVVTFSTFGDGVITETATESGMVYDVTGTPTVVRNYDAQELQEMATATGDYYILSTKKGSFSYKVAKGVSLRAIVNDTIGDQPVAQVLTWDDADLKTIYSKSGSIFKHIIGPTYCYPDATLDAEGKLEAGNGTEALPLLALDYQVAALEQGVAAKDLTTYAKEENVNRIFLGTKDDDFAGNKSQSNSYGMHIILKADQNMSVKAKTATVKKGKSINASKLVEVTGAENKVTYTAKAANAKAKKALKISKGKITVKKGAKKGSYNVKVTVKAAGDDNYKAASKTVTATVKVK